MKEQIDTPTLIPTQTNSGVGELEKIYKMALDLCISRGVAYVDDCRKCHVHEDCLYQSMARGLYNAGYRKQSEKYLIKENGDILPLTQRSEWISVTERLPESTERVLVFLEDDWFTKPIGEIKIDTDRVVDGKWVRWGKHVTHWMPLPEPPEMKGGAE